MVYSPAIWPLVIAAACVAGLALYTRRYRDLPAVRPFTLLLWLGVWYAVTAALGICTTNLPLRIFWSQMAFITTAFAGPVILALVLEYTRQADWLTQKRLAALLVIPVITNLLADTSTLHRLFRYDYAIVSVNQMQLLVFTNGPWFWVHVSYTLALLLVACTILVLAPGGRISWRNKAALVAAIFVQASSEILYLAGITPVAGVNLSPVLLIIFAMIMLWAVLRDRLFGILPISQFSIMNSLEDPLIVLDNQKRVALFNQAAGQALGLSSSVIGMSLAALDYPWAKSLSIYQDQDAQRVPISVKVGSELRYYDLSSTTLHNRLRYPLGRLLALHDASEREQVALALRRSEESFARAQSVSRVGSWTWHISEGWVEGSAEMSRLVGLPEDDRTINLTRVLHEIIHPADRPLVEQALAAVQHELTPASLQVRVTRPDGSLHHLYLQAGDLQVDDAGKPLCLSGIAQDLTQRIETEDALRENEAKFRSLFEQSQDGIDILNQDEEFVDANEAYCRIVGYTRSELLKLKLADVIPPELRPEKGPMMRSDQLSGKTFETYNLHRDGRRIPVEVTSTILSGAERLVVSIVRDVSERKWAEESQRESEERYRSLVMYSPDAILVFQHDRVTLANYASSQLFGAPSPEAMLGISLYKLVHSDYHELLRDRLYQLRVKGTPTPPVRQRMLRLDNQGVDVELSAAPFSLEGEFAIHVIVRDISERLRSERALHTSEQRYRSLLDVAPVTIIVYAAGKVVFINPAGVRMLGAFSADDLIGKPFVDFLHPDDRAALSAQIRQMAASRDLPVPLEGYFQRLDGTAVPVEMMASPLVYQDASAVQVIAVDTTERKQYEATLLQLLQREKQIADLGRELASTLDIERVYRIVTERLGTMIDCPNIAIELYDADRSCLNVVYIITEGERLATDTLPTLPYRPGAAADGRSQAIVSQRPVVMNDLLERVKSGVATLVGSGEDP
ncbi:MAG: PAS domain S-box protein, partial [Anaerolineae bacterium]